MKKITTSILTLFICLIFSCIPSFAEENFEYDSSKNISDNLYLFSDDAINAANQIIDSLVPKYEYDIAIITTDEYFSGSAQNFANNIYDDYGYGYGPDRDGIILVINMATRDVIISTYEKNNMVQFGDREVDKILDEVTPLLTSGEYDKALMAFIETTDSIIVPPSQVAFNLAVKGIFLNPVNYIVSLICCLLIMIYLYNVHRPVKKATQAENYIVKGSLVIDEKSDVFTRTFTSKEKIKSNSSSGGGRGGSSHGGGSRKF